MKIGVVGASGRMGQMCVRQVSETAGCTVCAATEAPGHPALGQDAGTLAAIGEIGVPLSDDAAAMVAAADAIIDFTAPAVTAMYASLCKENGTALIAGTTGLDTAQEAEITGAAKSVPVVRAPNMSVGVTLLLALTEQVAGLLGEEFDIEIVEMHHRHKVDAPSGTAIGLGEAAAAGREVALGDVKQAVRDGHTGARPKGEIGFATLRGGDVVGDHTVVFAGEGERIELTHKAASRVVFASGAVRAALWTQGKAPGLYSMKSVLGFDD
ncbi:MAG: 4-hydroxy-tetrahydrodipicolinate reductase [Rhodospirillaceae bacterium]|nr:4-hydroxy-tetrahydrodipicolinate reductase [Rhodospirillaceae bacterium]HAA92187.1 4-hydroxy-tetrahydrodipicolinate reductase [Rhodospirillaceae bacterium]